MGSCAGGLFATLVRHNINIDKKSLHIETPHLGRREPIKVLRLTTPHLGQNKKPQKKRRFRDKKVMISHFQMFKLEAAKIYKIYLSRAVLHTSQLPLALSHRPISQVKLLPVFNEISPQRLKVQLCQGKFLPQGWFWPPPPLIQ